MSTIGNGAPYWLWTGGDDNGSGGGDWKQPTVEETVMAFDGVYGYQMQDPVIQFATKSMDVSHHSSDIREHDDFNPDTCFASYSKPRLKWTLELHDHFVNVVNELGGPYKATPKAILNLMSVPGITLYHIKSHLQKYRLGKIAKRLCKNVPKFVDNGCRNDAKLPSNSLESHEFSLTNPFNMNGSLDGYRVDMLGTQHQLNEETITTNMQENNLSEPIDVEGLSTTTSHLLPLFPIAENEIYSQPCDFREWFEVLDQKPVIAHPFGDISVETNVNTLGYSSEFASINGHVSGQSSMRCGSFSDDFDNFLNFDASALATDADFLTNTGASNFPIGATNYISGL